MFDAICLALFAGVMYFCLIVAPTIIEAVKKGNVIKSLSEESASVSGK